MACRPERALLAGPAEVVAPLLVGARLRSRVGRTVTVVITEVEAYGGVGADEASHAHRGRTPRNGTMFGRAGLLYDYLSHGLHWCLNVVTGPEGQASAVLLRAGRVVEGFEVARARRPAARTDRDLARGPGRLGAALGVTGGIDGLDLLDPASPVRLLPTDDGLPPSLVAGPRIGISKATDRPWRWHWAGEPSVSR
jgi:DNA-3-methyladenine glycosylase